MPLPCDKNSTPICTLNNLFSSALTMSYFSLIFLLLSSNSLRPCYYENTSLHQHSDLTTLKCTHFSSLHSFASKLSFNYLSLFALSFRLIFIFSLYALDYNTLLKYFLLNSNNVFQFYLYCNILFFFIIFHSLVYDLRHFYLIFLHSLLGV